MRCSILPKGHLILTKYIFIYIHWYQTKIAVQLVNIGYIDLGEGGGGGWGGGAGAVRLANIGCSYRAVQIATAL